MPFRVAFSPVDAETEAGPEDVLKVDSDEDGIGGDDAADALRYLVANRLPQIRMAKLRGF